ncbi:hypothetical protein BN1708_007959 [Verticillium longisporum]|uniref:Deoxyhypusine hydroxylase n=2 Tax=Verticillium longisporum TaxID=100787 RepID=A0A0G4MYS1_VERLO|nr:hypothetical protein BN1708_007959 [Verticillium longisporum]
MSPSADPPSPISTETTIAALRKSINSEATPLPLRFRALFSLKHLATVSETAESNAAIDAIAAAFASPSALLKHELAYCLGQTGNLHAVEPLRNVLSDLNEDPMCRHEAAEALGALGDASQLDILRQFRDRDGEEVVVTETCEIAIDRLEWETSEQRKQEKLRKRTSRLTTLFPSSDFTSIDPAPPMEESQRTVDELEKNLMDQSKPLFVRYRAMFALRDLASPPDLPTAVPAVLALAKGLADPSALFRHEIAFVFGQLSHPASIPALTAALSDTNEASMVRHEAAEALGSLGEEEGVEATLLKFLHDDEKVVRESVIVALDMAKYEASGQTEYALIPEGTKLSHPASIPALTAALSDTNEASMVRHEAAEALGSLGEEEGVEATLLKFLHDDEKVVRESVIVALDMAEYEASGQTEYALIPEGTKVSA